MCIVVVQLLRGKDETQDIEDLGSVMFKHYVSPEISLPSPMVKFGYTLSKFLIKSTVRYLAPILSHGLNYVASILCLVKVSRATSYFHEPRELYLPVDNGFREQPQSRGPNR